MHAVQLSDNLADRKSQAPSNTEEARIHAEIAVRILELRKLVGPNRTVGFFERTLAIAHIRPAGPEAYWALMHLMTGDLSEITKSYSERGLAEAKTKQASQQELERIIESVHKHFPELADAIMQIRNVHANVVQHG